MNTKLQILKVSDDYKLNDQATKTFSAEQFLSFDHLIFGHTWSSEESYQKVPRFMIL